MDRGRRAVGLKYASCVAWLCANAACAGAQYEPSHPAPGPYTEAQRSADAREVVRRYEHAVRAGRDAYVALWDFHEVGALERVLQRYDLYRGDPLGEPEDVRRAAPPVPFSETRERRNVTNLFPFLGSHPVGGGACHSVEPRGDYVRTLITYEPLPPEDVATWGPLRDHVLSLLACGGMVDVRCDHGDGALALVYARLPCHQGRTEADSRLWLITAYLDDGYPHTPPPGVTGNPCYGP